MVGNHEESNNEKRVTTVKKSNASLPYVNFNNIFILILIV